MRDSCFESSNGSGALHKLPFYKAVGPNGKFEEPEVLSPVDHADLWDGVSFVYQGYGDVSHEVLFWEAS